MLEARNLEDQMALCISQRRNLEAIFNCLTDGIVAIDSRMLVVNMNRAAEEIIGRPREEVVGAFCGTVFHEADGRRRLAAAVQKGRMLESQEVRFLRADGEIRALQVTTQKLQDEAGRSQGVMAIFRDMTELKRLRSALQGQARFERLVGKNHRMREIYQLVEDIGGSDATVLILGESGTGKELVAEAIHKRSSRGEGPFVKVNCSALSEGLLESELFGHVKGAFTGAIRDKVGRFELAGGGAIFLDEIGDISPTVQVKLLRVLQDREFERVGSTETLKANVRVIAATHQNLKQRMAERTFREDLYYRLYVVPIELPPLRARKEDIPLLLAHFVGKFGLLTGKPITGVSPEAIALLMDYDWPGNIRELENAIEHAFVKCHGKTIVVNDLPLGLVREAQGPGEPEAAEETSEKERLLAVLEQTGWNRSRASRMLGMHRTTVWRKMKEYGIVAPDFG